MTVTEFFKNLPAYFKNIGSGALWAMVSTLVNQFNIYDEDFADAVSDANILSATGFWLGYWGSKFGIAQLPGESDDAFRMRIINQGSLPRVDPNDIITLIQPYSSTTVTITESEGGVVQSQNYGNYSNSDFEGSAFYWIVDASPPSTDAASYWTAGYSYVGYSNQDTTIPALTEQQVKIQSITSMLVTFKAAGTSCIVTEG